MRTAGSRIRPRRRKPWLQQRPTILARLSRDAPRMKLVDWTPYLIKSAPVPHHKIAVAETHFPPKKIHPEKKLIFPPRAAGLHFLPGPHTGNPRFTPYYSIE